MKIDAHPLPASLAVSATIAFIAEAHRGQKYGDMPYFFHPVEVAMKALEIVDGLLPGEDVRYLSESVALVALLHDIIEDTDYTEDNLRARYSDDVVDADVLLTLDEKLDYLANIQRIIDSRNLRAMIVKLADNRVNRGGDKSKMTAEKAARLNARYDASIAMLTAAFNEMGYTV
jgi:(p)ppGpp synthase/HD superfamily hydrolase